MFLSDPYKFAFCTRVHEDTHKGNIKQWQSEISSLLAVTCKDQALFTVGAGADSVTKQCQLLSNEETKVRVLDTPGLADSQQAANGVGVIEANRALFRSILRVQDEFKMKFDRVVYFLPMRGSLERADGNLQDELKVMHFFYGSAIFDSMVIIATYHHKKQDNKFTDDDKAETKEVLERILELVTNSNSDSASKRPPESSTDHSVSEIACPPIEHLRTDYGGEDILHMLQKAPVKNQSGLVGKFCEHICSRCPVKILYLKGTSEKEARDVIDSEGKVVKYHDSTCHPLIIPKYSDIQKVTGGVAHILTGGAFKVYEALYKTKTFPGFYNSDEICPVCDQPPGAPGCKQIGELCDIQLKQLAMNSKIRIQVDHASQLDKIKSVKDSYDLKG